MLAAIVWGLVQGLTEFLPISSSGHLVIVPAYLEKLGFDIAPPSLGVSAVLHLGTLAAVLIYFRDDILKALRLRTDPEGRKIALLVIVGSVPALIGFPLRDSLDTFQDTVSNVGFALVATGLVLLIGQRVAIGMRRLTDGRLSDAVWVGLAQALALIPGISRSGMTITAGGARGFEPTEAVRYSFLLGIPAVAGAGLLSLPELVDSGEFGLEMIVAMVMAAISGYVAIRWVFAAVRGSGLTPFAIYCLAVGALTAVIF